MPEGETSMRRSGRGWELNAWGRLAWCHSGGKERNIEWSNFEVEWGFGGVEWFWKLGQEHQRQSLKTIRSKEALSQNTPVDGPPDPLLADVR